MTISWWRNAEMLHLLWRETGGPPIASPPARSGFGTQVMEGTIRRQLRGQLEYEWDRAGLACKISLPLAEPLASVVGPDIS